MKPSAKPSQKPSMNPVVTLFAACFRKKGRLIRKTVSLLMSVILLCLSPLGELQMKAAFAAPPDASAGTGADSLVWDTSAEDSVPYSPLIGELTGQREQDTKTFLRRDGANEVILYPYAVHYQENGRWKDIDNTLIPVTMPDGMTAWTNRANEYQVWFREGDGGDSLVKIEKDGCSISWTIPGMSGESRAAVSAESANADQETGAARLAVIDGRFATAGDLSRYSDEERDEALRFPSTYFSEITYRNAVNGIDIRYAVKPQMIEEFFEASTASMAAELGEVEILINCEGVTASRNPDGSVSFINEAGEAVFALGQPYMKDAAGEISGDIQVSLTVVDNQTQMAEENRGGQETGGTATAESPESQGEKETAGAESQGSPEESGEINPTKTTGDGTSEAAEDKISETIEDKTSEATEGETSESTEDKAAEATEESGSESGEEPAAESETTGEVQVNEPETGKPENGAEPLQYLYRITPNTEWLEAEERAYPVSVDPNIFTSVQCEDISDVYVHQGTPDYPHGCAPAGLKIGATHANNFFRTFLKFNRLPDLADGNVIIDAGLYLHRYWNASLCDWDDYGNIFEVYQVLENWEETTITWNTQAAIGDQVEAIDIGQAYWNSGVRDYNRFDLTGLVKRWYAGTPNYGIMIRSADEDTNTTRYYEFISSEVDYSVQNHPYLSIVYVDSTGLEPTWSYHTQSGGRSGTAYVNDYTGNLTIVHETVQTNGGALPLSICHVYHSGDRDVNIGFGKGWRLNILEEVSAVSLSGLTWYQYLDGDGTRHYYYPSGESGVYLDEMEKKNRLTVGNGSFTLTDASFVTRTFNSSGKLVSVRDANGNAMTIAYNGNLPETVTDSAGRTATLYYSGPTLSAIQYPDGTQAICYYNADGTLNQIRDADGNAGFYATVDGSMVMIDPEGYQLWYDFDPATGRVSAVRSITQGTNIEGPSLSISYGWNVTSFTDNRGRTELVRFNYRGQPLSVQDAAGRAAYGSYSDEQGKLSKLTSLSGLQKTSVNRLSNGNIESGAGWTFQESGTSGNAHGRSTAEGFLGSDSLYLTKNGSAGSAGYTQQAAVTAGKTYTFSAYLKGAEGAYLSIRTQSGGQWKDAAVQEALISADEWNRTSVTCTVPGTGAAAIEVAVILPEGASGTVYADCLQLEEGELSRYNLLSNSDFQSGAASWSGSSTESGDGVAALPAGGTHPGMLDGNGYTLKGNPALEKMVSQTVEISGKAGDSYVYGGWMKAYSVPTVEDEAFGTYGQRQLSVIFMNGTTQVGAATADFGADTTDWQYLCSAATAPADYTSVIFRFAYPKNCNRAWFDGLQLYREGFGERYAYDGNGNLTQIVDREEKDTAYEYNSAGDIIKATDKYGDVVTYTYDAKHNVLTSTALGTTTAYTYDSKGNVLTTKVYGSGSPGTSLTSSASYSEDGAFRTGLTDALGNTATFSYQTTQGLLTQSKDPLGNQSSYTYDNLHRLTGVTAADASGKTSASVTYTYTKDDLTAITRNGMSYGLVTDVFGHTTGISAAGTTLVTNTYDCFADLLTTSTYGNGYVLTYEYDGYDRLTAVKEGGTVIYRAYYDGDGRLYRTTDEKTGVTSQYDYDLSGKLMRVAGSDGTSYRYYYDGKDNLSGIRQTAGGKTWTVSYGYDSQYRPATTKLENGKTVTNTYDSLSRLTKITYGLSSAYTVTLGYGAGANGGQSTQLSSYQNGSESAYQYTYDKNGNIKTITQNGKKVTYTYDGLNQLTREDNQFLNKTIVYAYDGGGNLMKKTEYAYTTGALGAATSTITYSYGNAWKDQLTSYNGESIAYDAIGNPTTYRGWSMSWSGRNLTGASKAGTGITYTYDKDGQRTSKTVGGVTTTYTYQGSLLMAQQSTGKTLYFSYDSIGKAISVNYNGTEYYYLRNGQGDIVGLLDGTGKKVVSYRYDSWGKLISTTGTLAGTLGKDNPLRYRGYYYDEETGLYWLLSRYYDPETGRFISADEVSYLGADGTPISYNLYTYCYNNPANMLDSFGDWPKWIESVTKVVAGVATVAVGVALIMTVATTAPISVVITATVIGTVGGAATNATSQYMRNSRSWNNFDIDECITAGVTGGLSGALATTDIGKMKQGIGNAILSGTNSAINGNSLLNVAIDTGIGFLTGLAGGDGTGRGGFAMNETLRSKRLVNTFLVGFGKSSIVSNVRNIVTGITRFIKKAIDMFD